MTFLMYLVDYTRIQKRLREQGAWEPQYALGLAPVAALAAAYRADARRLPRQMNVQRRQEQTGGK